jgi:phosphotransferase system enzyme I (PtsP)
MADATQRLALIENISSVAGSVSELREALDAVVKAIATGLETEVCSLYLLDPNQKKLFLRATVGLSRDSVGKVSMHVNEGLVGLVIETMAPVAVLDAISHPRYKYFPETGEERYHSFLGVPLLSNGSEPLGVLVLQTLRKRKFSATEIRLVKTAASQLAQMMTHFRLRETLLTKEKERDEYRRRMIEANRQLKDYEKVGGQTRLKTPVKIRRPRLVGLAAAPGFGHGVAHLVGAFFNTINVNLRTDDPEAELRRLDEGLRHSRTELDALRARMATLMPESELKIFDAHRLILEDDEFIGRIRASIEAGYSAESALFRAIDELSATLLAMADGYLRERASDFRDVGHRLLRHLRRDDTRTPFARPTILVAEELTISHLTLLSHQNLVGIALQSGGATSHASILARSFEIPTVVGIEHLMASVSEGDDLVLDGNTGALYIKPAVDIEREYDRLAQQYADFRQALNAKPNEPAITPDGHRVHILANIALQADVQMALRYGAEGIGLFRSEFSFLTYEDFPDESEQVALYSRLLGPLGDRPVTIRTLDIGADKYPSYMRVPREDNPFLGWRSIRVSLEMPAIFKSQLRAILRAAARHNVRVLFPMISSLEELRQARELLSEAQDELFREGIEHNPGIRVGAMIEVPAAVWLAPQLIQEVDFFSIGTNDLIQYLLAADRNNPKVAQLYEPLHPAVLQAVSHVYNVGRQAGKEVCICGEMASDPMATLVLIGMGLTELSLSPLFIPVVREIVRKVDFKTASLIAHDVLEMATVQKIKGYLIERYRDLDLINLVEMYR